MATGCNQTGGTYGETNQIYAGYFAVFAGLFLLDYFLFFRPQVKEISYKEFRDLVAADSLESVVISESRIYGMRKEPPGIQRSDRVAQICRTMIRVYGMSKRMPNISLVNSNQGTFLGQELMTTRHSEKNRTDDR